MLKKMKAAVSTPVVLGGIAPATIALSVTVLSIAAYSA
jgi:hypothetical protein